MKSLSGRFLWLRDWFTLPSVDYVAVIHQDRAEMVRLSARNRHEVVLRVGAGDSTEAIASEFFESVSRSSTYYGQPIAVLINNFKAFSYVKQICEDRKSVV